MQEIVGFKELGMVGDLNFGGELHTLLLSNLYKEFYTWKHKQIVEPLLIHSILADLISPQTFLIGRFQSRKNVE